MSIRSKLLGLAAGVGTLYLIRRGRLAPSKKMQTKPRKYDTRYQAHEADNYESHTSVIIPPSPEAERPEAQNRKGTTSNEAKQAKPPEWTDARWQTVFAGIISFATIASGLIAVFQWQVIKQQTALMSRTLDEARETREVENRAYINVLEIHLNGSIKPGTRAAVSVVAGNSGETPARLYDQSCRVYFSDTEPMGTPIPANNFSAVGTVAPGSDFTFECAVPDVSEKMSPDFSRGWVRLYVVGALVYIDVFQRSHKTTFCFTYLPESTSFRPCSEGNTSE